MTHHLVFSFLVSGLILTFAAHHATAVTIRQIDGFDDGTSMGWGDQMPPIPKPPIHEPSGGPAGTGDDYLKIVATGFGGPGSRLIVFNRIQWTGDYLAAGVDRIVADMANFGNQPLFMRLAIQTDRVNSPHDGTWYGSTTPQILLPDGLWHSLSFGLTSSDLSLIEEGERSLAETLASVDALRFLSIEDELDHEGDAIIATLGIDNITAIPEPSSCGLALIAMIACYVGGWRRRRVAR